MRIALIAAILVAAGLQMAGCSPASLSRPPAASTGNAGPASPSPVASPPTSSEPAPSLGPSDPTTATTGAGCPITPPNGAKPPEGEAPADSYLGNGRLWTVLWPKGLVLVLPDAVEPDGGRSMKFPWWRAADVHGSLRITGHELTLGLPVQALVPDGYGDTGFQASGIAFPVEGCHEVTGEAGGAQLTFVTMVRSCSAIAELPPADRSLYSICDR